jgi:hypothetical protein
MWNGTYEIPAFSAENARLVQEALKVRGSRGGSCHSQHKLGHLVSTTSLGKHLTWHRHLAPHPTEAWSWGGAWAEPEHRPQPEHKACTWPGAHSTQPGTELEPEAGPETGAQSTERQLEHRTRAYRAQSTQHRAQSTSTAHTAQSTQHRLHSRAQITECRAQSTETW